MDLLGLGSKVDVEFLLDPQGQRKQIDVRGDDNKRSSQYIYYDGEDVSGMVKITSNLTFFYIKDFFSYKLKLRKTVKSNIKEFD
jgi:hypothetical protein